MRPTVRRPLLAVLLASSFLALASAAAPAGDPQWRQPAEFEPQRGTMIAYPLHVPIRLVVELAEDDELVTVVQDAAAESAARALYQAHGVDLANCSFLHQAAEAHWTRDYGPWFAFDPQGNPEIVDFTYEWPNSPGDDGVPVAYAQSLGLPSHFMDLVTAGGNYMTDGQGTAMSAGDFFLFNNQDKTPAQIDAVLELELGIERHHFLDDPGMYWWHIDCYAKYLDVDTILVAEVAPSHDQYQQLEDTVSYLEQQISAWGTPYEVVRVFVPSGMYYANTLILNDKVLVPVDGNLAADDAALDAFRNAMPGYEVIGVPKKPGGWPDSWVSHDALHCRVKELADTEMLYVGHRPRLDGPAEGNGFPVRAEVFAHSGASLLAGSPQLVWRVAGGSWNALPMAHVAGDDYEAAIPAQPAGTAIEYYVHAEDASGRAEDHPYVGADGPHGFVVEDLGTDVSGISAQDVGPVRFLLDAGAANAGRPYFLLGSASGTSPGIALPGGLILPLNLDAFLRRVRAEAGTPAFQGFSGTLDGNGQALAVMDLSGGALPAQPGESLHFAFLCLGPFDYVSNTVEVKVLD